MHFLIILVVSAFSLQIIYLGTFLFAFHRRRSNRIPDRLPGVTVIVAAHDEEENLRELIPLLLAQNHHDFEVIIVEDRCNDGTYDYLLESTRQHQNLKMVRVVTKPEHVQGKKYALTLGIRAAKHDWILLTDADCRPVSDSWITTMCSCMSDDAQIVLGCSPYFKQPGWLNAFIRYESFLTSIQFACYALLGKPYMGVGRNLAYRKSLFLEHKGFHGYLELTGGDDDLFVNRHATATNVRVCFEPMARVMSKPKISWSAFWYQKRRHLAAGKHYKVSDKILLGIFSASLIVSNLFLIPLFVAENDWRYLFAMFLLIRWTILILLFHRVPAKAGDMFESWKAPILDFLFAFYYLVAGFYALLSQKVRWKK